VNVDRWLALIGVLIGIAGILISIWAFKRGEKRRIPTFVTALVPETLAKAILTRLEHFSLTHKGKPIGESSVTAFFVYFWNDGRLPILASEITSPYTIGFGKNVRILSLSITKMTRPVLGAKADLIRGEESDSVELGFSVLEPGDGIRVQIIIDGPADTPLIFNGSCFDSKKVRVLPANSAYFETRAKRFEESYMPFLMVGIMAMIFIPLGWLITIIDSHLSPAHERIFGISAAGIFVLFLVVAFAFVLKAWYHKWTATSVPPEIRNP
jgi:hypothetical protein